MRPVSTPHYALSWAWSSLSSSGSEDQILARNSIYHVAAAELVAGFPPLAISECAVKTVVVLVTDLPFFEWTEMIPNASYDKSLLDRITDRRKIWRRDGVLPFRRTLDRQKDRGKAAERSGVE